MPCKLPHPQGKLHLPVPPESRENSRFPSIAQQPSSPPGNNSAASRLSEHLFAMQIALFFVKLSLFLSPPSEPKAVWKKKKGIFLPFQNAFFETVWAHADRGKAKSWWIYDHKVKGLGSPTGNSWWGAEWALSADKTEWLIIAGNKNWQRWLVLIMSDLQGYRLLCDSENRCMCECEFPCSVSRTMLLLWENITTSTAAVLWVHDETLSQPLTLYQRLK